MLATGESITSLLIDARNQAAQAQKTLELVDTDSDLTLAIAAQTQGMEKYISDLLESLARQQEIATTAAAQSQQIASAVDQIAQIARATKILNVNAQIEAGRMGEAGKAFTVIADEMASLSSDVEKTNAMISNLAGILMNVMPQIEDMTNASVRGAKQFTKEFGRLQRDVVRVEQELRAQHHGSAREAERIATHTLEVAQTSLSRLQFQDPMAQSLIKVKLECEAMMETVDTARYEIKLDSLDAIEANAGEADQYGSYYLEKLAEARANVAAEEARRAVLAGEKVGSPAKRPHKRQGSEGTAGKATATATATATAAAVADEQEQGDVLLFDDEPKSESCESGDVMLFDEDESDEESSETPNEGDVLLFDDEDSSDAQNADEDDRGDEDEVEVEVEPAEDGEVLLF